MQFKLIDDMLNNSSRKPNNFIFHFMKAQLFTELNDPTNARDKRREKFRIVSSF